MIVPGWVQESKREAFVNHSSDNSAEPPVAQSSLNDSRAPGARSIVSAIAILCLLWLAAFAARYVGLPGPLEAPADGVGLREGLTAASLDHLASLVQAAILLLSAIGLGAWVLRRAGFALGDGLSCAAFGGGLGLGVYSLLMLLLGSLGVMSPYVFALVPVAAMVLGGRDLCDVLRALWCVFAAGMSKFSLYRVFLWTLPIFLLMVNVIHAFIPPLQYDVAEYHLAAPMQYWRAGHIFFIHDNVYANFPQNVEMLYTWALVLKGQLFPGLYLAQLVNVGLGVWAACCVGAGARRMFGREAAGPALILFYVLPWTSELSGSAYVELALTGYAVLTVIAFIEHVGNRDGRWAVLAGACAGLAFGCKYPAALFLVLPLICGIAWVNRADGKLLRRRVLHAGLAVLLLAGPWLARNAINTGNPTYPLLHSVFGAGAWSSEQAAKFARAHRPQSFSPADMASRTSRFFTQGDVTGTHEHARARALAYILVMAMIAAAWLKRPDKAGTIAIGWTVLAWVLWLLFTHRIGRFLVPWTAVAVVLAGGTAVWRTRWLAQLAIALAAVTATFTNSLMRAPELALPAAVSGLDEAVFMRSVTERANFSFAAIDAVNELGSDSRTLFLGEAQTLYCTGDVIAPTVFDRHPLEELLQKDLPAGIIAEALAGRGITHLYINMPELVRLRDSFDYQYVFDGDKRKGMWNLDDNQWQEFARFMRQFCEPVYQAGRPFGNFEPDEVGYFQAFARRTPAPRALPYSYYIYRIKRPE